MCILLVRPICLAADQFWQYCLFASSSPIFIVLLFPAFLFIFVLLFLGYGVSDTLSLNRAPPGQCRTKSSPIPVSWAAEAGALEFWGVEFFLWILGGYLLVLG